MPAAPIWKGHPVLTARRPRLRLPTLVHFPLRRRPEVVEPLPPDPGPVFVLSGGARMGAVQVGILRALSAAGVRPAALVGTSAGAFNAAFVAFHPEDERFDGLRGVWQDLQFHRIFNRNPLRMYFNAAVRRDRIYSNGELRHLLQRIEPDDLGAAKLPLHVVATNLSSGEKAVFSTGSVVQTVLASSAIPGFFPPVSIGGELYVDGAVTANLDLDTAVALGARHIVAIDVSASVVPTQARSIGSVLARSLEIVLRDRTFGALERLEPRARITLLRPGPITMRRLGGLRSMRELLDEADELGTALVSRAFEPDGQLAHGLVSTEPFAPLPALAPIG
jgi:NTE family protein